MWIIDINGEEEITYQGALDELHHHQTQCGESKVNISLWRRKRYQSTYLEDIWSRFYQVRPLVSHLVVRLPDKPISPNNVDEALKGPQRQFWKEYLFVQFNKNKNVNLLLDPIPIKYLPDIHKSYIHPLLQVLSKVTVIIYGNLFHTTVQMVVIRFK